MSKVKKEQRVNEIQADKSRMAIANMGFKDNAPPLITIIGPDQSGKTTLLNSIIKKLWRKEKEFKGILTIKANKKRYSFYEAQNTLENCMDTIKVSDMIIFVISLEVGMQKDTLEALTMMNSIGVPKFLFALTYYDKRMNNKTVDEITKRLQKEFSFPIKYFCLEIKEKSYHNIDKMVRQIEAMKYRPVEWKCSHPHVVVDNYDGEYAYGYVRGGPIGYSIVSHIPGFGDFNISEIEVLKDPCPLDTRGNIFHNPGVRREEDELESSSADLLNLGKDEIRMFEGGEIESNEVKMFNDASDGSNESEIINSENSSDLNSNENSFEDSSDSVDIQDLKNSVKSRFKQHAENEDELIEKFNEEYKEKEKADLNILETLKRKELRGIEEIEDLEGLIIPGKYVKMKINLQGFNFEKIIIIGTHLPSENIPTFLKGQVSKNKWQKYDLKSNDPYLISMGWFRFQTIPIFFSSNKLLNGCKKTAEIGFFGPSVQAGSSFLIYDLSSNYHILGSGNIQDASGNYVVKKRIKLVGYPKTINGQNVIIQSMFSTQKEGEKFLNAKIETASGLRGLIKTVVGKDGCVRAAFEGTLLMSDLIYLKCFIPIMPIKYYQNISKDCKLVKKQINKVDHSKDESEESEVEKYEDEFLNLRNRRNSSEIKRLERKLPYSFRKIKEVEESIILPIAPEQRKLAEAKSKIEAKKSSAELEQKILKEKKIEKQKAKREEEALHREDYKRKSAVKSHLEKKKHKKSSKK